MTIVNLSDIENDMERLENIVKRLENMACSMDESPAYCSFEIGRLCTDVEEWRLSLEKERDKAEFENEDK